MAYQISEKCTSCEKCVSVCPVEAIAKGAQHCEINSETCVNCGLCADECPVEAISEA